MKFLQPQKGVVISTIIIAALCFSVYHLSGIIEHIGMSAIIGNPGQLRGTETDLEANSWDDGFNTTAADFESLDYYSIACA